MSPLSKKLKNAAASALSRGLRALILARYPTKPVARSFDRVVIAAPLAWDNGIARGARYQYAAMREVGINVSMLDVSDGSKNPFLSTEHRPGSLYIVHCGGPQTSNLMWSIMPQAADAYKVAYWAWELPDPAPDWRGYDALVDEIWTPSEFSRASIAKQSSKPIHVVPHFIKAQAERRKQSGDTFRVLVMADSRSSFSRKNPAGAIRAFGKAFASSTAAHLYVKLSGRPDEIAAFTKEMGIAGSQNITIINEKLSNDEMIQLFRSVDIMLSLHRAEGFGLPMMEAMSCGTPVMATAWSGNADFLHQSNGFPVDYKLIPVNDRYSIYTNSVWADPSVESAAAMLRELSQNRDRLEAMSIASYQYISDNKPSFPF